MDNHDFENTTALHKLLLKAAKLPDGIKNTAMVELRRPASCNTAVAKLSINKLYSPRYPETCMIPHMLALRNFPQNYRFQGYELVIEKWIYKHTIPITDLEATSLAQNGIPMKNKVI